MERQGIQISLTAMIALVACVAFNLWLFRLGVLWGFVGLNISKHVIIAYLCQLLGVNRRVAAQTQASDGKGRVEQGAAGV